MLPNDPQSSPWLARQFECGCELPEVLAVCLGLDCLVGLGTARSFLDSLPSAWLGLGLCLLSKVCKVCDVETEQVAGGHPVRCAAELCTEAGKS